MERYVAGRVDPHAGRGEIARVGMSILFATEYKGSPRVLCKWFNPKIPDSLRDVSQHWPGRDHLSGGCALKYVSSQSRCHDADVPGDK